MVVPTEPRVNDDGCAARFPTKCTTPIFVHNFSRFEKLSCFWLLEGADASVLTFDF